MQPKYLDLLQNGRFQARVDEAWEMLRSCALCPRECGVDRLSGERGVCGAGLDPAVSSYNEHHGEEPPISGFRGSGTIFLTHCNLKCLFCQNYPISHLGNGNEVSCERLAKMMLALQRRGCHNINFVTPTHYMPQILKALHIAAIDGLNIPLVYNCGGYESLRAIKILDGIIDIYMPDMKYSERKNSEKFSKAPDYFERACAALEEMHSQVGVLQLDSEGIAVSGLLIRHLVMPSDIAGSEAVLNFIAKRLSPDTYVSVMSQYFPAYRAFEFPEIARRITDAEYSKVVDIAEKLNLTRGWIQGHLEHRL
ncbi:MAG: radical SAM protein [bacterium]